MKTREEVDALEVMGLDRMQLLAVPRIVGLVITLPLLTFYADAMGLAGGAVVSQFLLGVQPAQYLIHVRHAVDLSDFFVGLFKAPLFAFVIGAASPRTRPDQDCALRRFRRRRRSPWLRRQPCACETRVQESCGT